MEMASLKRLIFRNTLFNSFSFIWSILLNILLLPFMIEHIGIVGFGVYVLVISITGYFALLDLGIGVSLVKLIAEHNAKKQFEKMNEIISTAFFTYAIIGLIVAAGLFSIATLFLGVFNMPQEFYSQAQTILYIVGITSIFSFPLLALNGVLSGLQRYDLTALIGFITATLSAIVTVAVLLAGFGIVELVLFISITQMLCSLLNLFLAKKLFPSLRISPALVSKKPLKTIFSFSLLMFLLSLTGMITFETDRIVIGIFLTVGLITFYEVNLKLNLITRRVFHMLRAAIIPTASDLNAKGDFKGIQRLYLDSSKYLNFLFFPFVLILMVLAKPIIAYWVGAEFAEYYLVAEILLTAWFFVSDMSDPILTGIGKIHFMLFFALLHSISNLILSIWLVGPFGLIGVALGTALPAVVFGPTIFLPYVLKTLKISFREFFREIYVRQIIFSGLMATILLLAVQIHYPQNIIETGIYGAAAFAFYFWVILSVGLRKDEREFILSLLAFKQAKI